jgi:hypothetical protein
MEYTINCAVNKQATQQMAKIEIIDASLPETAFARLRGSYLEGALVAEASVQNQIEQHDD